MKNNASTPHAAAMHKIVQKLNQDLQHIHNDAEVCYQTKINQFIYVDTYGETFTTACGIEIQEAVYSDICRLLQLSGNFALQANGLESSIKVEYNIENNLFHMNDQVYSGIAAVQSKIERILALKLDKKISNASKERQAQEQKELQEQIVSKGSTEIA